jgi:hypothetical protein
VIKNTATDPTTGDGPLGVYSAMNAALSHKILSSGGRRDI